MPRTKESGNSPLEMAASDPVAALALLVEACERGEKNLRPYLDAAHEAIATGTTDAEKYAELAGRFQAALKERCPE